MLDSIREYVPKVSYDDLFESQGKPRPCAKILIDYLSSLSSNELAARRRAVNAAIQSAGVSFTVYSDSQNIDRAWPLDVIPRIMENREWQCIKKGLEQRLRALNLFINDVYNEQHILKAGIVPKEIVLESKNYREPCVGFSPAHGVWAHICGSDLVRDSDGTVYVLEDNLRVPSGVSYMLENRHVMKRVFPELFANYDILPVSQYNNQLYETLCSLSPRQDLAPTIAVLTPGIYNSAYFEHSYLAQQMGAYLVQGSDLVVGDDDVVYMRTIRGLQRVDVIYRRVDDEFIDPEIFRKDSILGAAGMMRAWRAGNVAIANAPGAGVADDKVIYAYVPDMIRFYLDEEPLLPNVPTYLCRREDDLKYVLSHMHELVIKPANESGGYGMLIGPKSTRSEINVFREHFMKDPDNYIAQPTLSISTVPTLCRNKIQPRHVDLRPFVLQGKKSYCTTGGLCRVALKSGSLVVNSSQGGGSKDLWIVESEGD